MMSLATRLVIALLIVAALGFPIFVWSLARDKVEPQAADGIVVLTGGEDRLPAAVKLLEEHKGQRLLISGVHQETTRKKLIENTGADPTLFANVDLGRSASNTIGNASETAAWAAENKYQSIIVVTASYHMPRTLVELEAVSPEVRFVPYPVFPDGMKLEEWWSDPQTTGVLVAEYGKYLASVVRVNAAAAFGVEDAAAPETTTIERGSTAPPEPIGADAGDAGK
jgi:uncharacterized SAM-binding protein YcdF (DUF218 family)